MINWCVDARVRRAGRDGREGMMWDCGGVVGLQCCIYFIWMRPGHLILR